MKKQLILSIALLSVLLLSSALFAPGDKMVLVDKKDFKQPDWQWSSGEVRSNTTTSKEYFTLSFGPSSYHSGDSVQITFNSYKVIFGGITDITTFHRWIAGDKLVCNMNKKWVPLVKDTNNRINRPFSGVNNNRTDSLINYSVRTVVPKNGALTLTVSNGGCEMDTIDGHGKPMFTKGYATLTTSIKGIEVKKL